MEKFKVLVEALEAAEGAQPTPDRWEDIARWLSTRDRPVSVQKAKVGFSARRRQ